MRPTERTFYLGVIAVLSVLLFFSRSCNQEKKCQKLHCEELADFKPIEVTSYTSDTVEIKDSSSWRKTQPVAVKPGGQIKPIPPPGGTSAPIPGDTSRKVAKNESGCDSVKYYNETYPVTAGEITVESIVRNNRLDSQKVSTNLKQITNTVEKTVTKVVREEPRGRLYVGIAAQGTKTSILDGFGAWAMWKSKRDRITKIQALYGINGEIIYQAGMGVPISFRRRR